MSVRPTDVGLGRFRKGGGQRGGGVKEGQRGSRGEVQGGGQRGGGGVKEGQGGGVRGGGGGQKRVKKGGVEGGECQREERKRFEKKDDFNEKSISKRVF